MNLTFCTLYVFKRMLLCTGEITHLHWPGTFHFTYAIPLLLDIWTQDLRIPVPRALHKHTTGFTLIKIAIRSLCCSIDTKVPNSDHILQLTSCTGACRLICLGILLVSFLPFAIACTWLGQRLIRAVDLVVRGLTLAHTSIASSSVIVAFLESSLLGGN